jgi:hypothetical protein
MGAEVADGLRIESITEKEKYHPGNDKITVYQYAGGQIFMPGGYFHFPKYIDSATNEWKKVYFQNMFLTAHQMVGGSNHGYGTVTESRYDGNWVLLGKTQTTFSNIKTPEGAIRYNKVGKDYFEYPYTDKQYLRDWEIGLPLKVVEYDQNNRIVSQTENAYDYSIDNSAADYISNIKTVYVASGTPFSVGPYWSEPAYLNKKVFTDAYYPFTGTALLRATKTRSYVTDTRFVEDSTLYAYDGKNNIKAITTQNSKGEKVNTVYVYNYDVGGPALAQGAAPGSVLYNMTNAGLEKVVSIERWKQVPGGGLSSMYNQQLISSFINTFSYQGGILLPKSVYDLKIDAPLGYTAYTGITQGSPIMNPYSKIITAFQDQVPQYMDRTTEIKQSDVKGNPLETRVNNMELYKSMIWDTTSGKKLAEVSGAKYADIAFSGFEASNKGNLVYDQANVVTAYSTPNGIGISGNNVLRAVNTSASISHPGLTPGKEYILSFWCKSGTPTISGAGLGNIPITVVYSAGNGWQLYNARFTPVSNAPVGFMQTGSASSPFAYYLDDVRIYPASATMQTYNYNPLFGLSSAADANGQLTYYEYDPLGRQTIVRDQKGNIISKTKTYNAGGL